MEGSRWFRKFKKECEKMSPHIQLVRIKYGFYRIYWTGGGEPAYMHEVYKWMPMKGYVLDEKDPRFDSQKYYQEYEDTAELTLKVKNFVEGFWDSMETMKKRVRLFRNNKDFYNEAVGAYRATKVR